MKGFRAGSGRLARLLADMADVFQARVNSYIQLPDQGCRLPYFFSGLAAACFHRAAFFCGRPNSFGVLASFRCSFLDSFEVFQPNFRVCLQNSFGRLCFSQATVRIYGVRLRVSEGFPPATGTFPSVVGATLTKGDACLTFFQAPLTASRTCPAVVSAFPEIIPVFSKASYAFPAAGLERPESSAVFPKRFRVFPAAFSIFEESFLDSVKSVHDFQKSFCVFPKSFLERVNSFWEPVFTLKMLKNSKNSVFSLR